MVSHSGFLHTDCSILPTNAVQVAVQYVLPLNYNTLRSLDGLYQQLDFPWSVIL